MSNPFTLWRKMESDTQRYVACAIFTPGYRDKAERLAESLKAFGIGHAIYETPIVHRSISPNGGDQIEASKPQFISKMLDEHTRPILYLDADVVVRDNPELINSLCKQGVDFATYNWLADSQNDTWHPHPRLRHLWKFFFTVNVASHTQLATSGAVQLWNQSTNMRGLLADWKAMLMRYPRAQDDQALDAAHNRRPVKAFWLPKSYARYAFWLYEKPVLDHPGFPQQNDNGHFQDLGMDRFNRAETSTYTNEQPPFPRDVILDVVAGTMVLPDGRTRPLTRPVYLSI
jgi:hypothetical protein